MPATNKPVIATAVALILLAASAPAGAAARETSRPGMTERATLTAAGGEADLGGLNPSISANGRYVAVTTSAALVPADTNGRSDVYVRDRWTGGVEWISQRVGGGPANGFQVNPSISADGSRVAFYSNATDLVPGSSGVHTYVHDRAAGTTTPVSGPGPGLAAFSFSPAISGDGRFVAFIAPDGLIAADTNGARDVYVRDLETGSLAWASVDPTPQSFFDDTFVSAMAPAISRDGRFIAFHSGRAGLVPGDTNNLDDVFVRDMVAGTTERVSVSSTGLESNGGTFEPSMSADGRYVAFWGYPSNLTPSGVDSNGIGAQDVYVHDRLTRRTRKLSVTPEGEQGDRGSLLPVISADGRFVVFNTSSDNLRGAPSPLTMTVGAMSARWLTVVADLETMHLDIAALSSGGAPANGHSTNRPAISGDGRFVAFTSLATNLVPGDTNGKTDVFVRDRGPALGLGGVAASAEGDRVEVSGWARIAGGILGSATDAVDAGSAALELGGELVGVTVGYRPTGRALSLRLALARVPGVAGRVIPGPALFQYGPSVSAAPGIVYGVALTSGATRYEVRAGLPPGDGLGELDAGLYTCNSISCTLVEPLRAHLGTTDAEVVVTLPLAAIGADEGSTLGDVKASTRAGAVQALPSSQTLLDEVVAGAVPIHERRVEVGFAPAGQAPGAFVGAGFDGVSFGGTYPAVAPGSRLWVRACFGSTCTTAQGPQIG